MRTIDDVLTRVRAEFVEVPGLRLTSGQVQRLCVIEPTVCQLVLRMLVDTKFLCMQSDGVYARLIDRDSSRARAGKDTVDSERGS